MSPFFDRCRENGDVPPRIGLQWIREVLAGFLIFAADRTKAVGPADQLISAADRGELDNVNGFFAVSDIFDLLLL